MTCAFEEPGYVWGHADGGQRCTETETVECTDCEQSFCKTHLFEHACPHDGRMLKKLAEMVERIHLHNCKGGQ